MKCAPLPILLFIMFHCKICCPFDYVGKKIRAVVQQVTKCIMDTEKLWSFVCKAH